MMFRLYLYKMSLVQFCNEHVLIANTLVGFNAQRMTALEIKFKCSYDLSYAIAVVESAESIAYSGKYKELIALLNAISQKRGLDWNYNCDAWEQWEMDEENDENTLEKANQLDVN